MWKKACPQGMFQVLFSYFCSLSFYPFSFLSFFPCICFPFLSLFSQKSLPYINFRIANIPGADAFINYVIDNKRASFYGYDWYVRDYIHPDDLNDLFAKSIGYLIKGEDSLTINAGVGIAYHFDDIVDEVERATGDKIERHFEPEKQGDIVKIICDIRRAKDALNWSPNHTRLQETIDYAVRNK